MKLYSLPAVLCLVVCLYTASTAQTTLTIKGTVTGIDKKPVAGATVSLLKAIDSAVVKTSITNTEGKFILQSKKNGKYIVSVISIGSKKFYSEVFMVDSIHSTIELPLIELQPTTAELQAVSVKSVKPYIETKIDRTIVNVDALVANSGVSAWEVLQNAPGVIAQDNGSINLAGKNGVLIFIDDKPTYLSGADLASYLRSLPSSVLDKIEIMTNPPAKYDAAGNAGIINIRIKRANVKGFSGNINTSYNQSVYHSKNASFNFTYRNNQFNVTGFISANTAGNFINADNQRNYFDSSDHLHSIFSQHLYVPSQRSAANTKIGIDYYLDKKTTFGIVLTGLTRTLSTPTTSVGYFKNNLEKIDSFVTTDNNSREHFTNGSINLNYRHQLDTIGSELTADADYIHYNKQTDQLFYNAGYLPGGMFTKGDTLTGNIPSNISIYAFKSDYSHVLKNHQTFEAGVKASYTETDNIAGYFAVINKANVPDYSMSNHFIYGEHINAAYLNYNKEWKRFSMQSGLRLENTISTGHQLGNALVADSSFKRSYTNLFPTVYFQYKFDNNSKNQLIFSYGRRINRPGYSDLNPFLSPYDKYTIFSGNPYLQPVFSHNFELKHVYKNFLITTLSFSDTKNEIVETAQVVGDKYYDRPANIGKSTVVRLAVNATVHPAKWWTMIIFSELQYRHYNTLVYGSHLDTGGAFYGLTLSNQFNLKNNWTLEQSGFYRSPTVEAQLTQVADYTMNIGVRKRFWKNKASVRLSIRDIFYSHINAGIETNLYRATATYHEKFDSRTIGLTFTWSFGKLVNDKRKHDDSSADDEKNRVK